MTLTETIGGKFNGFIRNSDTLTNGVVLEVEGVDSHFEKLEEMTNDELDLIVSKLGGDYDARPEFYMPIIHSNALYRALLRSAIIGYAWGISGEEAQLLVPPDSIEHLELESELTIRIIKDISDGRIEGIIPIPGIKLNENSSYMMLRQAFDSIYDSRLRNLCGDYSKRYLASRVMDMTVATLIFDIHLNAMFNSAFQTGKEYKAQLIP